MPAGEKRQFNSQADGIWNEILNNVTLIINTWLVLNDQRPRHDCLKNVDLTPTLSGFEIHNNVTLINETSLVLNV